MKLRPSSGPVGPAFVRNEIEKYQTVFEKMKIFKYKLKLSSNPNIFEFIKRNLNDHQV